MPTTNLPELIVVDVGHGNCAVAVGASTVSVFDAPRGNTLIRVLEQLKVATIDRVIVSHADSDHIGGILTLLLEKQIRIRDIYLNSDSAKNTRTWRLFRSALKDARTRGEVNVVVGLTSSSRIADDASLEIEIVAPSPEVALGGVGGTDLRGRELTSNSMSAVVRILFGEVPVALLCGDLDVTGLENMLEEARPITASVLVFPHHGGLPDRGSPQFFAKRLTDAVTPSFVVFSLVRGAPNNPRPEIVAGVRQATATAHVACTQLSERCAASLPLSRSLHFSNLPARGDLENSSCGGTLRFTLIDGLVTMIPTTASHSQFVVTNAPTALCRYSTGATI